MIGLPLFESLVGKRALAQGMTPPTRLLYYYIPNGIHMDAWTPTEAGADWALTPILQPLANHKDDLLILSGLANDAAKVPVAGDHARGTGSFLTCTTVKKTEGDDIENGISVDQVAANAIGSETPYASLQLGIEGGASVGNCDSGYSCAYSRNISWAGPTTPLPKITNPQLVFDRLFINQEGLSLCATSPGLQELRKLQGELVSAAGGPAPDPDEVFYPHVSLGYFSQEISEEALSDALDLADLHPIVVVSPRLSLIELGRDDRMYTWRVVAQQELHS